jgi:hypothetical protein
MQFYQGSHSKKKRISGGNAVLRVTVLAEADCCRRRLLKIPTISLDFISEVRSPRQPAVYNRYKYL